MLIVYFIGGCTEGYSRIGLAELNGHYKKYGPRWYDDFWKWHSVGEKDYHRWVIDEIMKNGFDNILDLGSGDGAQILPELLKHNKKVVALDFSWEALRKCQWYGTDSVQAWAEKLPFNDNSFDVVIACEILEHTDNVNLVIDEIRRVCRKWVILTVPNQMAIEQHKYVLDKEQWMELLNLDYPIFCGQEQFGWIYDKCDNSILQPS